MLLSATLETGHNFFLLNLLQNAVVLWKMKAPAKKPLVRREDQNELNAKVRKGAMRSHIEPLKALSEFQEVSSDSFC